MMNHVRSFILRGGAGRVVATSPDGRNRASGRIDSILVSAAVFLFIKVTFTGRFFKLIPFRYSVILHVVQETHDRTVLSGSSDLGRLAGGKFTYHAVASSCTFHANYRSSKDRGYFHLTRSGSCR